MRTFVAVNLDDPIKDAIEKCTGGLRDLSARVKWVEKHNLHLTLNFLGEIRPELAGVIAGAIKNACAGTSAFEMSVRGMGCFPERGSPRIVWAAVDEGAEILADLAGKIRSCLAGFPVKMEDKKFRAHITVGRIRKMEESAAFTAEIEKLREHFFGLQTIKNIDLMESRLTSSGPDYTIIAQAVLK